MKAIVKAFMLTTSVIGASFSSQAQTPTHISGQVIQAGSKPVEFATVTLLKATDSSLVKGAIADIAGKYEFEQIKNGKYIIAAAFVGMNKVYSSPFDAKGGSFTVPPLELTVNSKNLKAIDVTARKPFIEQKVDRLVVNVEANIATAGGTAMEALEKSPNITVDKDGNISMKGKGGVMILIDGKQTSMSNQDIAELLKSMPATSLDQIELISNPSAKYDAAGNAGVINLKLKKNSNYGTNGNLTLGGAYGTWPRYNGALNLNSRSKFVNVFGSYNYSHRENQQSLKLYRTVDDKNGQQIFDQRNESHHENNYQGGRVGADFFVAKNHTVGVLVDLAQNKYTNPTDAITNISYGKVLDSILQTYGGNNGTWKRGAYNINYRGVLDSTGKELNVDLDYSRSSDRQYANIFASTSEPVFNKLLNADTSRSNQPSIITIKTAKADYTQPLGKQGKLEIGAKISFVTSDNDARFDSLRMNNWQADTMRSNHFIYKENVNAAYVNFNKQIKKLTLQVGLRAEQTNVTGESTSLRVSQKGMVKNDTSYFNLFPSMALSYKADKNNTLGFSYSRRIQRPSYEDLNPFEFYMDRYTIQAGNPNLKPQYSHNLEVSHTFKDFLMTSVNYIHTTDLMMRIIETDKNPATGDSSLLRYKYMNVAKSDNLSFNVSAPFPIAKWWSTFTTLSVYYTGYSAFVNDNNVKMNAVGFFGRTQHTFTLTKTLTAEAIYFYVAPGISDGELFRMQSMGALDLGLQQKVLKGKGSLKLNVTDVLGTQNFRGSFANAGMDTRVRSSWDARQVRLNFSYRFGNTNVKAARSRKTGLEAEQSRSKASSN
ncbi:TonB-dependent receptor domain-containing protein [Chitinophaga sp. sic0106]|uniref:TonB-dependent receptor domain-containing protein n=1 Tax=Chitinophaga sp. sic0106 TaxID=2854785 RepID=UPI001C447838|nr:TonB-dependent receptor [Chitinophaga sp. sic0106]MBV7529362.1 TonB-dependent receptor [Chitinophaga sp. sic0106]